MKTPTGKSNKLSKPSKDAILSLNVTSGEKNYVKEMVADQQASDLAEFSKPKQDAGPADTGIHAHTSYDPATAAKKHVSEKLYFFPESFNALRLELVNYWPHLWQLVGWRMANNAQEFVIKMNDALDLNVQFDTGKVDSICKVYLNKLREARGVSIIH